VAGERVCKVYSLFEKFHLHFRNFFVFENNLLGLSGSKESNDFLFVSNLSTKIMIVIMQ